jgi:P27 family predicted phage terminase small subunit
MSEDARKVWDGVRRKLRGVELLDSLDTDMLAIYCDLQARDQAASKQISKSPGLASDEEIKQMQAWARNILSYAEKLGLTPNSRARLAKKKAEVEPLDDMAQILNDVDQFINGGQ